MIPRVPYIYIYIYIEISLSLNFENVINEFFLSLTLWMIKKNSETKPYFLGKRHNDYKIYMYEC